MRKMLFCAAIALPLGGCVIGTVAKTAVDVATLPVKAVSAGVDAVTTSQSEADEKRGRELRKEEEARGKQARLADERCRKGKPAPGDDCTFVQPR
jgi:isocitrate lyase